MQSDEHDRLFALTSSLPHLCALALLQMARRRSGDRKLLSAVCGGSFRSATRVARSSPEMMMDMFLTNRRNISCAIDELIAHLQNIQEAIVRNDEQSLCDIVHEVQKCSMDISDG
jgi:prephenate dehydrogenase